MPILTKETRYNDSAPLNDGSISLERKHNFYTKYQQALKKFVTKKLNEQDKVSYDILMDITSKRIGREQFQLGSIYSKTQVFLAFL